MWRMTWPLLLIIISNVLYNLCTKSIPKEADSFGTLILTYIAGAVIAYIFFLMHSHNVNPFTSFNMPSLVLGFAIVGLEAGYVYLYRAGWKVLLFVGALAYHENISLKQIAGAIVCMIGLYLMA